jgi:hypothetical protein
MFFGEALHGIETKCSRKTAKENDEEARRKNWGQNDEERRTRRLSVRLILLFIIFLSLFCSELESDLKAS